VPDERVQRVLQARVQRVQKQENSRPACNACRSKKIQSVHARRVQPTVKKKEISNKATN
jgi:hypothetical protein